MVHALVFDLGGVLVNIDFRRACDVWGAHAGVPGAELARRFGLDAPYDRHERGEITAPEYFASLRDSLQISLADAQWEQGWNAILLDENRAITSLIARVRPGIPLYVFSNSNETHKRHWMREHAAALARFDRVFVSSDIGLRKPEPQAYLYVAAEIGVAPEQILFFDDLAANVEGARSAGLQAVQVTSPDSVAVALAPFM
jgi:putative hydrolase of the HAD superfamily